MSSEIDMQTPQQEQDSDVFSRGSLEMTASLINSRYPDLSQEIIKITTQEPVTGSSNASDNPQNDEFRIKFDSESIRLIIEALTESQQTNDSKTPGNTGMNHMARALLEQWIALAATIYIKHNKMPEGTYILH